MDKSVDKVNFFMFKNQLTNRLFRDSFLELYKTEFMQNLFLFYFHYKFSAYTNWTKFEINKEKESKKIEDNYFSLKDIIDLDDNKILIENYLKFYYSLFTNFSFIILLNELKLKFMNFNFKNKIMKKI